MTARYRIRPRVDADAAALVAILDDLHRADRYPYLAEHASREWVWHPEVDAAWVAVDDGDVPVGHIGIERHFRAPGMPDDAAGVVRLFVARAARGHGLAERLIATVLAAAGGRPVGLEVLEAAQPAIARYERLGWVRVHSAPASWRLPDGSRLLAHWYLAPARTADAGGVSGDA